MELEEYITTALDRDFLLEALETGLLRHIVEECFLRYDTSAVEILSTLFAHLVTGFSFQKFLKAIPKSERTQFLSDLLFHIYYGSFALQYFANEPALTFYCIKLLSAKASDKTIKAIFKKLSITEQTKLYGVCLEQYDEGSYRLLKATKEIAPSELTTLVKLAPKSLLAEWIAQEKTLSRTVLKNALAHVKAEQEAQVADIAKRLNAPVEDVRRLVEIFGLYNHQVPANAAYLYEYESLAEKLAYCKDKTFIDAISNHLKAQPEHYIEGIDMIGYALPTRGKELRLFAWLDSVVEGLQFFCRYFKIKKKPFVLVFDQSEKKLFRKNAAYIKSLHYPILHIDTAPILYLAKSLGIEGLFVTDGDEFGFGGSRNAILLFTPLLKHYYEHKIDIYTRDKKALKKDFSEIVLKEKHTPPIVHMGDDDVHVPISTIFSDALFAYRHQKEYFCRFGWLAGRKTVLLDTTFDVEKVLTNFNSLILQHPFQNEPFSHGMATILTKPKLCLNLPFGTEEAHFTAMNNYDFDFREPALHLSGYRFPQVSIPKNRFSGLAEYLRVHYRYIHGMRLVVDLIDPTNRHKACILPWNKKKHPFNNLGDAIEYIVRPDTIRKMQKQFQKNLKDLESTLRTYRYNPLERPIFATTALSALDTFTPNKKQPVELTKLFKELIKDYAQLKRFLAGNRVDYGQNLTHSLALLTNIIENARFQKWLLQLTR